MLSEMLTTSTEMKVGVESRTIEQIMESSSSQTTGLWDTLSACDPPFWDLGRREKRGSGEQHYFGRDISVDTTYYGMDFWAAWRQVKTYKKLQSRTVCGIRARPLLLLLVVIIRRRIWTLLISYLENSCVNRADLPLAGTKRVVTLGIKPRTLWSLLPRQALLF